MKAYYIQADKSFVRNNWEPLHLGVQNERWCKRLDMGKDVMELVTEPFWIGPGKTYVDLEYPLYNAPYRTALLRRYIYRGCTLIITQLPIESKLHMKDKWESYKQNLKGMAIDYMIAPRISLKRLDPEMIRYFGRRKVPFILVEVEDEQSLLSKKWDWINQAQGHSFLPISPLFTNPVTKQNSQKVWNQIIDAYEIRTLPEFLNELPLSVGNLYASGISPFKGELRSKGEADYNLFRNDDRQIEAPDQMFYHRAIPYVTVLRGKVIRAHVEMNDEKGYGRYKSISIPNHFTHR